jgi:hypothetical protein
MYVPDSATDVKINAATSFSPVVNTATLLEPPVLYSNLAHVHNLDINGLTTLITVAAGSNLKVFGTLTIANTGGRLQQVVKVMPVSTHKPRVAAKRANKLK